MKKTLFCAVLLTCAVPARAEPIGQWWSGWGQGVSEYGITNVGESDQVYVACSDTDTSMTFRIDDAVAEEGSEIIVKVGQDEFSMRIGANGVVTTDSRVDADNFTALWAAMRNGSTMSVEMSDGRATTFSLAGSAKALPAEACTPDYYRF